MTVRRAVASLSLVAALFSCADASAADMIIKSVNVPFDFVVRGQVLPAGQYSVLTTDQARDLLILRNVRTGATVSTLGFCEHKPSKAAKLVFDTVNGENVLRAVITRSSYSTVPPIHHQKHMAGMKTSEAAAGR